MSYKLNVLLIYNNNWNSLFIHPNIRCLIIFMDEKLERQSSANPYRIHYMIISVNEVSLIFQIKSKKSPSIKKNWIQDTNTLIKYNIFVLHLGIGCALLFVLFWSSNTIQTILRHVFMTFDGFAEESQRNKLIGKFLTFAASNI